MTTAFLIIGGIGLAVLILSMVVGELLEFGPFEADGPFSTAALASFLSAFGFGAAIAYSLVPGSGSFALLVAVLVGTAAAIPAALLAIRLTRAVMNMRTDPTPTRDHLVGATGTVVTPIPVDGYGEVRVQVAGQQMKLNARADKPLATGAEIFVLTTLSETSVRVDEVSSLLGGSGPAETDK